MPFGFGGFKKQLFCVLFVWGSIVFLGSLSFGGFLLSFGGILLSFAGFLLSFGGLLMSFGGFLQNF